MFRHGQSGLFKCSNLKSNKGELQSADKVKFWFNVFS